MRRCLVLFAREPARQAREKGFRSQAAEELFRGFARGWLEASRRAQAPLIVATPREDRFAWARALPAAPDVGWICQRGDSLGARLEDAARRAAAPGGRAVLVGGDVAPSAAALIEVFEALEGGADAAIAPAPDGGVSLLALAPEDLDLLGGIRERRRTLLRDLLRALSRRGRRVSVVALAADVDGRRSLRFLLRTWVPAALFALVRLALRLAIRFSSRPELPPRLRALANPSGLRAPPLRRSA
jgi:2-phospho-L-lactate guanylyltransferase (CobY/MobA/RfbA family)